MINDIECKSPLIGVIKRCVCRGLFYSINWFEERMVPKVFGISSEIKVMRTRKKIKIQMSNSQCQTARNLFQNIREKEQLPNFKKEKLKK